MNAIALQSPFHESFGNFELLERIGLGGMATVHRAVHRGEGGFARELVVKRILPQLAEDKQFVHMFIEEAKLGAFLNHPNIVQIFDLGHLDSGYFMAMEYIEGVSLQQVFRHHGEKRPIDPSVAAYVILQVLIGLDYAHTLTLDGRQLGLVHRDVSPANVMISTHGQVKLLDFGIAKAVGGIQREETRSGTLKGKLSYMSPEQVHGHAVTARSDIFVTGILLWELLTGRRLFRAGNDYQTLRNVVQADVPPLSALRLDASPALCEICHRALARDPKDRYQSAEEMADELDRRVLVDGPVGPSALAELVRPVHAAAVELQTMASPAAPKDAGAGASASTQGSREAGGGSEVVGPRKLRPPTTRWLFAGAAFCGGALAAAAVVLGLLFLLGGG